MALIKCPHCAALISDKAHRCPKCGVIQHQKEKPTHIAESTQFTQISNEPELLERQPLYQDENQEKNLRWLWFIIGGVICVGLVAWFFMSQTTSSIHNTPSDKETPNLAETEQVEVAECMEDTTVTSEIVEEEGVKADRCGKYTLKGKVNDKYDIQIWLSFTGSTMSGRYCYNSTLERYGDQPSSYIEIHGEIDSDNNFKFTGTSTTSSNKTEWTGTFDDNRFYAKKTGKDEEMIAYVERY